MGFTRLLNITAGVKIETTPYTYEAPATTDGLLLRQDVEVNLTREFIEDDTISGSLTKTASEPGMWADDLGGMLPVYARSGGTDAVPECAALFRSLMGRQVTTTDNTVNSTGATSTAFKTTTAPASFEVGQMIIVDLDGDGAKLALTQVISVTQGTNPASTTLNVWPPLPEIPVNGAAIWGGTNFLLADTDWPTFSTRFQFDGLKYVTFAGCRCTQLAVKFEVGKTVPLDFTFRATTPDYGYGTATDFAANLDRTTRFLTCMGIDLSVIYEGVAKGTPTTTVTQLATPDFGVAVGDQILLQTSGGWETLAVSQVSGNAGEDTTITHATATSAVSAGAVVYVRRGKCAGVGDSLSFKVEIPVESINCMAAASGRVAIEPIGRSVTAEKTPFLDSWQEFLLRDHATPYSLTVYLRSAEHNIMAWYFPALQNTEVGLEFDSLMKNSVTAQAVADTRIGNKNELVIASF